LIRGYFLNDSPFVAASVAIPRLTDRSSTVEFLIDTGAQFSVLHRDVLAALNIELQSLADRPTDTAQTYGGPVEYIRVRVNMTFEEQDGHTVTFTVFMRIAPESDARLPSVLGMDVLSDFDLLMSRRTDRVELRQGSNAQ
jgi:hypothetical protein